jgi:hypothetical protein
MVLNALGIDPGRKWKGVFCNAQNLLFSLSSILEQLSTIYVAFKDSYIVNF